MPERATRDDFEPALEQLSACFDVFGACIPRGEPVPIDALTEMLATMRRVDDGLPFELRDVPRSQGASMRSVTTCSRLPIRSRAIASSS